MENIVWGIPVTRVKKEERFNVSVVTLAAIQKDKVGRKFTFNKASQEALGLISGESIVRFGFADNDVFVMSTGVLAEGEELVPGTFKITAGFTFSDKKVFDYIAKIKNLDTTVENHLVLENIEGFPYLKVANIISDELATIPAPVEVENTIIEEVVEIETTEEVWDETHVEAFQEKVEEVVEEPVVEEKSSKITGTVKKATSVKTPEIVSEPAPARVKFAIDETEEVVEEEDEW